MAEKTEIPSHTSSSPALCCLQLLVELIILIGKIVLCLILWIFGCIIPKTKKSLKDQVVLITGAGRGLGKELAKKFASLEAIVVLWDINEKSVQDVEAEIRAAGGRARAYRCDVTDLSMVMEIGSRVRQEVGDVNVLVNNAGMLQNQPFLELDIEKIKMTFQLNVMAYFWTLRCFLPRMLELNEGHILAISSLSGLVGTVNMADYCATKFGILGLMESIEEEIRQLGKDSVIHCTTVCPAIIDTGMNHNPTTRSPMLMPILEVKATAAEIVDAVLRNERLITIPRRIYYPFMIQRVLPRKVSQLVLDFLSYARLPNNRES